MEKIIQLTSDVDDLYCLTEDGKIYVRRRRDDEVHTEKQEDGKIKSWVTGTYYWKEIPEEEHF